MRFRTAYRAHFAITPSVFGGFVIVTLRGVFGPQEAGRVVRVAHRMGRRHGVRSYLMDAREARNCDAHRDNVHFMVHDVKQHPDIDLGARVAILVAEDDHSHDVIESIGQLIGYDLKLFRDLDACLAWMAPECVAR